VAAFCRGEAAGIRRVYQRYSGPVFAVAISVLGDRELAADCLQEVFLRAWRASSRFDPQLDPAPWLCTIARRVAVDIWRARRHTVVAELPDDAVIELPPGLEKVWETFQVRAAVDQLPAGEREVIRLSHFEQLTHVEIAQRLGIAVGTVKSRSHRAHRRMAQSLAHLRAAPTAG